MKCNLWVTKLDGRPVTKILYYFSISQYLSIEDKHWMVLEFSDALETKEEYPVTQVNANLLDVPKWHHSQRLP